MTDPQLSFDLEGNVTYSNTPEIDLTSPAISISSAIQGRRTSTNASVSGPGTAPRSAVRATNQLSGTARTNAFATVSNRNTEPADAANPSPDTGPTALTQDLEAPTATTIHATDSQHLLAASPTDAAALASYTLSFGSQYWAGPSRPVLDFAPQPIYEPTGELVHEDTQTFGEFDAASIPSLPTSATNRPPPNISTAEGIATSNGASAVTAFVQPSIPRSALKRKTSSTTTTPTTSSTDKKARRYPESAPGSTLETIAANSRTVTFERMSGLGHTSPDEGSASSDLAGSRQNPSRRPRHQSTESTPRPPLNASASSQSSARHRTSGTRTATAHPPSILPPEKVFPIQIGSELFRLSGASISSDGTVRLDFVTMEPQAYSFRSAFLLHPILRRTDPAERGVGRSSNTLHRQRSCYIPRCSPAPTRF